jgi:thiol-disulfide isomerase/thioredoxin
MKRIITIFLFCFIASLSFAQLTELNQSELYEKVLNTYDDGDYTYKDDKPCVVLFFSPYCQYSKLMEKTIIKVAKKVKNKINFYKVNVFNIDDYTMENLEIEGTPTTLLVTADGDFAGGGGVATEEELEEAFEELLDY